MWGKYSVIILKSFNTFQLSTKAEAVRYVDWFYIFSKINTNIKNVITKS